VRCRYYARRSSAAARSARDLQSERQNRDVYATTPCVIKDAGAVLPPYELHFQTSPSPGWPGPGRRGCRRPPDADHDYESMDEEGAARTEPRYPGGGLTDAATCGYQTVGVETALRPGGNGYAATVVSVPTPLHVSRHCSFSPTTFSWQSYSVCARVWVFPAKETETQLTLQKYYTSRVTETQNVIWEMLTNVEVNESGASGWRNITAVSVGTKKNKLCLETKQRSTLVHPLENIRIETETILSHKFFTLYLPNRFSYFCIGLPIHCNYHVGHYSGFSRISPSILNRFTPSLQA